MDWQPIYLVSGLAKIFPPMSADEYQGLKDSIRAFGMIDEITLWRGQIIEGLHRLRACLELGIEPRFTTLPDDILPEEFVVGKNINRRNQNETARATSAVKAMRKSGSGQSGSRNRRANLRGAGTKPKPKWDVHLPEGRKLAGIVAVTPRPLIAAPSGSAVSPRLADWTARPESRRLFPALPPCCPSTDCQWPPLWPSPRWAHLR